MSKYEAIAEMVKRRIDREDYAVNRFPGIRKLAEDTGVSYLTARQALLKLVEEGVLLQKENSYFVINTEARQERPQFKVAFLTHHRATNYFVWENAVMEAAERLGAGFRQVYYTHDDDPVIAEVLSGDFDLVFFKHEIANNPFCLNLVNKYRNKVVTLFQDMTGSGIRCFDGAPPEEAARLADHLYELGHRRFAAVRVADDSTSAGSKVRAWEARLRQYGQTSTLHEIVCSRVRYSLIHAYEQAAKVIFAPERPTALFCASVELAIGLCRFCHEHGLAVGRDLSIASFGQPEMARMYIPSITVIDRPPPVDEAVNLIRDAMKSGGGAPEKLMYRTGAGTLIAGESTGPAPASNHPTEEASL